MVDCWKHSGKCYSPDKWCELNYGGSVADVESGSCLCKEGYIYDEELGDPDDGLAPGTLWEDIPDDWVCPDCGVSKFDFELMEE